MPKYYINTYGCQMNESDSERIASILEKNGYSPALDEKRADIVILNMCSVRQTSVDKVFGKINFFKKYGKNKKIKIIVTGCMLAQDKIKLKNRVDFIFDIKKLQELPKFFNKKFIAKKSDYLEIKPKYKDKKRIFIPISNGCDNFCTYCAVPFTRGRLICRSHKKILKEVKIAANQNPKEIWLLGQNVNDYNSPDDNSVDFAKLLKMVNDIPGNFKIRFMSPNPKNFSDDLIDAMAGSEKMAKFLNLPVQSGDNEVLKKMNRPYTAKRYENLVKKIRKKIPDINLTTDVIVGFPGETKQQFQNTVKLFKKMKFNLAYVAKYSPRPGTTASKMKDNISLKEKKRRFRVLNKLVNDKTK